MTLRSGEVFAKRFEIVHAAGAGGMGTVYRARDVLTSDWVALKILHEQNSGADESERFAREAQILSELRHPGIVAHVTHGLTAQGQRFLAMQWLDGLDLAQRLAAGPLTLSDTLTLMTRIAEALAFAHSRGIVHRDLKPTNLFLPGGDIPSVKILDFGVARRIACSRAITRTGIVIGTPEYMAPEQARGMRQVAPAADLFALGCVMYECLTGDPPFVADHIAAVLFRILFEEPVPVAQRRPGIPETVSTLLSSMLEKNPAQRLGDAMHVVRTVATLGDLQALPLLPAFPSRQRTVPGRPDSELVLLSLVLAISLPDLETGNSTMMSSDAAAKSERHGPLLRELKERGAQADLLPGGALAVTAPQLPSAQDQAVQAARLAILIKLRWPDAQVVVMTGRCSRSRGGLAGEVLDRAWQLLRRPFTSSAPALAPTSEILIDRVSAGLLESQFTLTPLPALDGFTLGSERQDADTGRLLLGKPTPCLGRDREVATLEAVYSKCKEERVARAVLVLGPPGLGKSRLRREFVRRLECSGAQGIVLTGRGDPIKGKSAHGILGDALRQWLELREGLNPAEQRERIRQRLAAILPEKDAPRITMFLGELCGVPFPEEESPQLRAASQDPRIMGDQIERAWLDCLQCMRADEPLLLILEDLHWSDARTVKLVTATLRRLRNHALMVLALARPEVWDLYPNLWSGVVQPLPLNPLPRKAGERLARQILGADAAPAQISQIVEQSAGNPLFLEELIRTAAERKPGELPETVMAMIQARIGRLSAATRQVLRKASVYGQTFWRGGLRADDAETALAVLIENEFIEPRFASCFPSEYEYGFRHMLMREAAYGLLNDAERMEEHRHAAHFLELCGERDPMVLAEHFQRGGLPNRAALLFLQAAEHSFQRNDLEAAVARAERGFSCGITGEALGRLRAIESIAYTWWRQEWETAYAHGREALQLLPTASDFWCRTIGSLFVIAGNMSDQSHMGELVALFAGTTPTPEGASHYALAAMLLVTMFGMLGLREQVGVFKERARQACALVPGQDLVLSGMSAYSSAWLYRFLEPDPWTAFQLAQQSVEDFEQAGDRRNLALAQFTLGLIRAELGDRDAGQRDIRAGLELSRRLDEEFSSSIAQGYLVLMLTSDAQSLGSAEVAEVLAFCQKTIAQETRPWFLGTARAAFANILLFQGRLEQAEQEARQALELLVAMPPYCPPIFATLIHALLGQGRAADADAVMTRGQNCLAFLGNSMGYGELHLRLAMTEVHYAAGNASAAQAALLDVHERLQLRAAKLPDMAARQRYLTCVPEHRRIIELFTKSAGSIG